jgi:hypothetical protein
VCFLTFYEFINSDGLTKEGRIIPYHDSLVKNWLQDKGVSV